MTKTVMIIHSANELFGADLVLLRAVKAFRKQAIRPVVLLPDDLNYEGLLKKELEKIGVTVYITPLGILRRKYIKPWRLPFYGIDIFLAVFHVIRKIKKENIDKVYSMTSAVIAGALAAKLSRRPHIYHVHEILKQPRLLVKGLAWWMNAFADHVISVSQAVRNHWIEVNPQLAARMMVIHNGIDLDYYEQKPDRKSARAQLGLSDRDVLIGCLGRIGSWKGQEVLIAAIGQLKKNHPNLKCLIGGGTIPGQEYKMAEFKDLIAANHLENQVLLKSFEKDIRPWMAAMDMFIVPSVKPDPFPTVVLEAMAFELPVIGSRHGGIVEMIDDQKTGYLFEPGNSHDLAQCINRILMDPSKRIKMGQAGKKRLKELFPLEKFEKELISVFET